MAPSFAAAAHVLRRAIEDKAFPAAVIEVGDAARPLWREPFGALTFEPDAPAAGEGTIFDLASLTKVLATAPLVMQDVERGALGLDDPVGAHIAGWHGADREPVTIRDLLAHCGGLAAHAPLHREHRGRAEFERAICDMPLAYPPRSRSIYSDLGFMLLGFTLGNAAPLPARFDAMRAEMEAVPDLRFNPPESWRTKIAPTQVDPWRGRLLVGEVDDQNAWAIGGAAGHAGLFGNAAAVGGCARHLLRILDGRPGAFRKDTLQTFITRRADVPGSSRALAWDTMLPTSSCGTRMSPQAFGHTGFTGTSLWIDPVRRAYVVLLTNRVYPTPANGAIAQVRPAVHDAVMDALER